MTSLIALHVTSTQRDVRCPALSSAGQRALEAIVACLRDGRQCRRAQALLSTPARSE
jgi:hypothetical protein